MLSQPLILGSTYRIKFKSIFERHGVCTTPGLTCLHKGGGVFRLDQIASFRDIVQAGIKLYDVFFQPLGISEEDYFKYFDSKPDDEYKPEYTTKLVSNETEENEYKTKPDGTIETIKHKKITTHEVYEETGKSVVKRHVKDSVCYAAYPVYKLVDVKDPLDVIYAPELTIDGFPEIDIAEYKDLSLVFKLGYIDNTNKLDPMMLAIRERLAIYGMNPSHVKLYSTGSKWLNHKEYEAIKTLREPAEIVMIPEADKDDYLNKMVITNGQLKKIAEPDETGAVKSGEISIDALATHDQVIDNNLFLVPCAVGEKFVSNGTYFRQETMEREGSEAVVFVRLVEMRDYAPESDVLEYRLTTQADVDAHRQAYKLVPGKYIQVAPERDRTSIPKDTLYVREIVTVDGVPTESYVHPTDEQIASDVILYTQTSETYTAAAYPIAGETYCVSAEIWRENPATVQAMELMGCKFSYTDPYQVNRTMTLELADIVDLAASVKGTTLPDTTNDEYWKKFYGRKFRYEQVRPGQSDTSLTDTIEVPIIEAHKNFLLGRSGVILGYSGQVSRETLVTDSTAQGRNYFIQYSILRKEYDALKERNRILEEAIIELQKPSNN